jgi:hypothetical protein
MLHLAVVERRDHRRAQNPSRDPGAGKRGDRLEPALGCRCPRLHAAGQGAVERRNRNRRARQSILRHLAKDVEVALDQRRFADDGNRMPEITKHLQYRTGNAEAAFGRLIGVGVAAERDRAAAVPFFPELAREQRGGGGLVE